ncbi:MAG: ABC transporter permease [Acidimicrobiales bacterium]
MAAMEAATESSAIPPIQPAMPSFGDVLVEPDVSAIPEEPRKEIVYQHKVRLIPAARALWAHREIIYTLSERDFRAQYKQATLGVLWAVISPVLTLLLFVIIFSRIKGFGTQGLPYPLYAFVGILCWNFFSSAFGIGGQSLLNNKALLAKIQFPRECFPLENMGVQTMNTLISWIPLAVLFVIFGRVPRLATLWVPMYMAIEIVFTAGITIAISAVIIQMRDLLQVLPIMTSLGLFATPVIWPFQKIPDAYHLSGGHFIHKAIVNGHHIAGHWVGGITVNLQMVYGFFNPLGPVIAEARNSMLLGQGPQWNLVAISAFSAFLYLSIGYRIFKRLEVNFADIA